MTEGAVVYLDANVFIDFIQGEAELSEPARVLFETLRKRPFSAITSELTLAEVLAPSSKGRKLWPDLKRQNLDLMVWSRFIGLEPISRSVLYESVALRSTKATGRLKLPDAIHLATAILGRCRLFISRDRGIPTPTGMRRVVVDSASLVEIAEALR